jgi:hypothetical protein
MPKSYVLTKPLDILAKPLFLLTKHPLINQTYISSWLIGHNLALAKPRIHLFYSIMISIIEINLNRTQVGP